MNIPSDSTFSSRLPGCLCIHQTLQSPQQHSAAKNLEHNHSRDSWSRYVSTSLISRRGGRQNGTACGNESNVYTNPHFYIHKTIESKERRKWVYTKESTAPTAPKTLKQ